MNKVTVIFILIALAGCATNSRPPVVASLEGKPRVQINKSVPPSTTSVPANQQEGK
jgi:hypothetical protein